MDPDTSTHDVSRVTIAPTNEDTYPKTHMNSFVVSTPSRKTIEQVRKFNAEYQKPSFSTRTGRRGIDISKINKSKSVLSTNTAQQTKVALEAKQ